MDTKKEYHIKIDERVLRFKNAAAVDIERMEIQNAENDGHSKKAERSINNSNLLEQYKEGYYFYKEKYEAIRDSTFWRITKPLRNATDWFRWKTTGVKREFDPVELEGGSKSGYGQIKNGNPSIGVHVHLFYEDLLDEFCGYLENIPEAFDLYISCRENADVARIKNTASQISHVKRVVVRKAQNRGRDIAPFYVLFGSELIRYELLLHIHTKKSLYTGEEKKEWRQWALDGVLKDEKTVKEILRLFRDTQANAGLIFGEMTPTLPLMALHWLYNSGKGRELLNQLHLKFENHMLFYPVGSFFWVKTRAIRPLFDVGMTYESFDEEKGQVDGTLAHALERVIACVNRERGYHMYIFDPETDRFALNISYKSFENYFSYNVENICDRLIQEYDIVSFDIFDTLITRVVYEPDDVFRFMERIIKERSAKSVDYLRLRKMAEESAWRERGDFCNIHDIYEKLPYVSGFSIEEAEWLKQLEIDLELEFCIPRKDVLELFNRLVRAGKKIILISDMYLTGDIIRKMLKKCGYEGYADLWVSCECGKRKDRGTLWDKFFEEYGEMKTIHVGDNPHSDDQIVGDRRRATLLLLSPIEQFRFSIQYEKYKRFIDGSIESSLVLGYLVNKCLYNSPFALKKQGFSQIDELENVIEGIFAPLFLQYMDYLHRTSHEDTKLLFLSREGFFLQKLYKTYCQAFCKNERENVYFLTSRRATSVAQIAEYEDAKELLYREYSGKMSTLFKERFGISDLECKSDETISLPGEILRASTELEKNAEKLLHTAWKEREAYLNYIQQTLGEKVIWNRVTLVDVGYSGTIQYYLMKILETQLDACYLVTGYTMKPDDLGGTYRSLYNFYKTPMFEYTQLFLEAVTAAPHGQVICFCEKEGHIEARLKTEKNIYGENGQKMQKYIHRYLEAMGKWTMGIPFRFRKDLAEAIFSEVLRVGIFGSEASGMFQVDDGYCMDGNWIYDEKNGDWQLQKGGEAIYLNTIKQKAPGIDKS